MTGSEDEKDLQIPSTEPSTPVRRRAIAQNVSGLPFGRETVPTVQTPSAAIMPSPGRWFSRTCDWREFVIRAVYRQPWWITTALSTFHFFTFFFFFSFSNPVSAFILAPWSCKVKTAWVAPNGR